MEEKRPRRYPSPFLQDSEVLLEVVLDFQKASYCKERTDTALGPAP